MSNKLFPWSKYSDQPLTLQNKAFKRKLYLKGAVGTLKTFLMTLSVPFFLPARHAQPRVILGGSINCLGLCVNPDYPLPEKISPTTEQFVSMVNELGMQNILIRFPLSDYKNKEKYFDFVDAFAGKSILVNILQDRDHLNDLSLVESHVREIFSRLHQKVTYFQVGNSVNRRKWAFLSQDEYFRFHQLVQSIRDDEFPGIKLIGSNIIDFELPHFIRSLIHAWPIKYDGVAAQLYVDRRGAPENKQLGCDTIAKINWFSAIMHSSNKTENSLWITETNWPLEDTEPFPPANGDCMVSEKLQAYYLVRYYLLAVASGRVDKCYWHQLVAPGYGLIDNRGETLRKRDAFYSYKTLISLINNGETTAFKEGNDHYRLTVKTSTGFVDALWCNNAEVKVEVAPEQKVLDMMGQVVVTNGNKVKVSDSVVYLLTPH